MKKYQKTAVDTPDELELSVPEQVHVAMAEITGNMKDGLLALAVGAGLQVMSVLMDADVAAWRVRRAGTIPAGWRCGTAPAPGR